MIKKFNLILLLFTAMIFSFSCSKEEPVEPDEPVEENPFVGVDNNITSFSLTKDGTTYTAAITGENIVVSVPVDIDLTDATVHYEISEQATIVPDPKSITNWNDENAFQVTSYSKKTRSYYYKTERTEIISEGNVTLLTQADVDAFAQLGNTVIEGSLVIGSASASLSEKDTIKSLEGLSSIKEVKYNVYINNTFGGTSLKGLDNITSMGALYIGSHTGSVKTFHNIDAEFTALESAGGIVINSESVQSLKFPALTTTSGMRISSKNLQSIEAPVLTEIAGDLLLTNASNAINGALTALSFPQLKTITGMLDFQYYANLETLDFPELSTVGGNINFMFNSSLLKEISMEKLEEVAGGMAFEKFIDLETVKMPKVKRLAHLYFNMNSWDNCNPTAIDFSGLEEVSGEVMIKNLAKIESISFPNLNRIGTKFTIRGCKSVSNLDIAKLESVGEIHFWDFSLVNTLDLSGISECKSYEFLSLAQGVELTLHETINDLTLGISAKEFAPKLAGVKRVNGTLKYENAYNLQDFQIDGIEFLNHLQIKDMKEEGRVYLPNTQHIQVLELGSYNLKTVEAPVVEKIDTVQLTFMWKLEEFKTPSLKEVKLFQLDEQGGNSSYYEQYARMTSLEIFKDIQSIEEVKIQNAMKLYDFSAFGELSKNIKEGNWSVINCKYTPTLEDMKAGRYAPQSGAGESEVAPW